MPKNKVKFNIKNVHYARQTKDAQTGAIGFDTPKAMPGAERNTPQHNKDHK